MVKLKITPMTYFFKIFALILFPGFLFSKTNCLAQYYDSSVLVNAALGLYLELPSGTLLSKTEDSLNKQLKLKQVSRSCYNYDTILFNKTTNYNENGTIRSVVTKFNSGTDSLVLTLNKKSENIFEFSFSFPFEVIKDTMDFGFADVIDSMKLNEQRYFLNVSFQEVDSVTAKNFIVSINKKFIEKRGRINLFSFITPSEKVKKDVSTVSNWDSTFENGYLVKTNIDSSNGSGYMLNKNYYHLNESRILRHEYFSKNHGEIWILRSAIDFFYDDFGRITKRIEMMPSDSNSINIDSLIYYPNGNLRAIKIYSPNDNLILSERIFSDEGKLLSEHFYGQDYLLKADEFGNAYNDNFYSYNQRGNIMQLLRYYNGKLIYFEEYEYEYWK